MRRNILSVAIMLIVQKLMFAQVVLPLYPDSIFSTYYQQRVTHFKSLPQTTNDIIFLGNSITDGAEWNELFADKRIKNRGISGDNIPGVIHRLPEIILRKPSKIFLMIGVNDLSRNVSPDTLLKNIFLIASYLRQQIPSTKLYLESILPVNDRLYVYGTTGG